MFTQTRRRCSRVAYPRDLPSCRFAHALTPRRPAGVRANSSGGCRGSAHNQPVVETRGELSSEARPAPVAARSSRAHFPAVSSTWCVAYRRAACQRDDSARETNGCRYSKISRKTEVNPRARAQVSYRVLTKLSQTQHHSQTRSSRREIGPYISMVHS